MDIAAVSMSLANIEVQNRVGIAMLDKAMDMGEDLAMGLVEMMDVAAMERSVHPELGGNVDIRI